MPDTGWRELVEVGWNVLADPERIHEKFHEITRSNQNYPVSLYGDGKASERVTELLDGITKHGGM